MSRDHVGQSPATHELTTKNAHETGRRSNRAIALMLATLALLTAADLATKQWALDHLSRTPLHPPAEVCRADEQGHIEHQRSALPPRTFVPGFIELAYAENCGGAFSTLRTAPGWLRAGVFGVAGVLAIVVLIGLFVRGSGGRAFAIAVPVTLSGAIGNLSDRVRHGFVVDFIRIDPELFRYPTFNVADIAIAIGVGLMLLDGFFKPKAEGQARSGS